MIAKSDQQVIVVPEEWKTEISVDIPGLNKTCRDVKDRVSAYLFLTIPFPCTINKKKLTKWYMKLFERTKANAALFILPERFTNGSYIKYWPDFILQAASGPVVTSVHFANTWYACKQWIVQMMHRQHQPKAKYYATCQYQHPYIDSMDLWKGAGAYSLHPGDYAHDEFLIQLKMMQGHWIFWGHGDRKKLRGYNHLTSVDILKNKPSTALASTLWFSCSTLDPAMKNNLALTWYASGSTNCLLASMNPVNTDANQAFSYSWLKAIQNRNSSTVEGIIRVLMDSDLTSIVLKNYKLLGWPWVVTENLSAGN